MKQSAFEAFLHDALECDVLIKRARRERNIELLKEQQSKLLGLAQTVARSKNPYYICDFAEYVDSADSPLVMPILQKAMEETGDIVHIYEFAFLMADCERTAVDYESLQNLIIESEDPKLICYSAEYVPTFDQKALAQGMIRCGNEKWLTHYIESVGFYAGVQNESEQERENQKSALVAKLLFEQERGYKIPKQISDNYEGGTIIGIAHNVLSAGVPYHINTFAENDAELYGLTPEVQAEFIRPFEEAMISTGDILHIYEFGASVPGADIRMIEDAVIESGMAKYMYYVGAYVPGADAERMLEEIKKTGNKKYVQKMEEHITEIKKEKK